MSDAIGVNLIRGRSLFQWATLLLLPIAVVLFSTSLNQSIFFWINQNSGVLPGGISLGNGFWAFITNFGDGFFLFPLAMLLFWNRADKQLHVILTMLIGALLLNGAKALIPELRPVGALGESAVEVIGPALKKGTFPSGHAGTAFLLAALAWLHCRTLVGWVALFLASLIALSRVVVGAHWPADIVAGAWVGIVSAIMGSYFAGMAQSGLKSRVFFILLGLLCVLVLPFYDNGFLGTGITQFQQYGLALLTLILMGLSLIQLYQDYFKERFKEAGEKWQKFYHLGQRLAKFGMVGASGFVVDMGVYTLLGQLLGVPHLIARGASYWVAATWNWFWNRTFTFAHVPKARKMKQWSKYLGMCVVSFVPNWGSYYLLTTFVPFFMEWKQLALIVGVMAGMLFNFTIASLFVFVSREPGRAKEVNL